MIPASPTRERLREIKRLIAIFNRKPLLVKCSNPYCDRPATYGSLYRGSPDFLWWCDDCDPYSAGASPDRLVFVRNYAGAVTFVHRTCGNERETMRTIIKALARAKGLGPTITQSEADDFFHEP